MMSVVRPDLRYGTRWMWLGCMVLVLVMAVSLTPIKNESVEVTYADKFLHMVAFMLLMIFLSGFIVKQFRWLLILFLYACGALIEVLQIPVPGRSAEAADLLADFAGLMLGLLLVRYWLGDWCVRLENRFLGP
jgi:VanZ family protein